MRVIRVYLDNGQISQCRFLGFSLNNEGNTFFKYKKLGWPNKKCHIKIKSSLFQRTTLPWYIIDVPLLISLIWRRYSPSFSLSLAFANHPPRFQKLWPFNYWSKIERRRWFVRSMGLIIDVPVSIMEEEDLEDEDMVGLKWMATNGLDITMIPCIKVKIVFTS